jgi:hypothetical protein
MPVVTRSGTLDGADVTCDAHVDEGLVIEVTTRYTASVARTVTFRNDDHFLLQAGESIELYKSRKYTAAGQARLLAGFAEQGRDETPYSTASDFGVATLLLSRGGDENGRSQLQ